MGQVTFGKDIEDRAILPHAGKYGNGLDYEADVELQKFEWDSSNKPGYAKEGEHYAFFLFKVVHEGKTVLVRHHEPIDAGTGSRAREILEAVGVPLQDNGDGTFGFDTDEVAPRKITGIEVGDPVASKKNPGVFYTGNLTGVMVIGA